MRKASLSVFELHVEKIVLSLAVIAALYFVVTFLILQPNTVSIAGEALQPSEIDAKIEQLAEQVDSNMRSPGRRYRAEEVPDWTAQVRKAYTGSLNERATSGAPEIVTQLTMVAARGREVEVPRELQTTSDDRVRLVTPQKPTPPIAISGHSEVLFVRGSINPLTGRYAREATGPTASLSWTSVAAYWDLGAQRRAHVEAGYLEERATPQVARIEIERQEQRADGTWSDWQSISSRRAMPRFPLPTPTYDEVTGDPLNDADLRSAFRAIKDNQLEIVQPRFFTVSDGDNWFVPPLPGYRTDDWSLSIDDAADQMMEPEDEPGRDGRDAPRGGRPPRGGAGGEDSERIAAAFESLRDLELLDALRSAESVTRGRLRGVASVIGDQARGQFARWRNVSPRWSRLEDIPTLAPDVIRDPDNPERVGIWFHDDTVVPRVTYQYRIRVSIWNRYVNKPRELIEPGDARRAILEGEWSEPSEPMRTATAVEPFIARINGDVVEFEVFSRHLGWWYAEKFEASVGDRVGASRGVRSNVVYEDGAPADLDVDFATGLTVRSIERDQKVEVLVGRNDEPTEVDTVVVTLEDATGRTYRHVEELDRRSALRKKLDGLAK